MLSKLAAENPGYAVLVVCVIAVCIAAVMIMSSWAQRNQKGPWD